MRGLINLLFGAPLASSEDRMQKIGAAAGVPVFGLDALGSAAYGPEAALTILLPLGALGVFYTVPITLAIVILLGIVYFSYRQTIAAYPNGGGSYTVAHENLGSRFGLLAAAALMIDYILNVAVGISTGVGALISAVPTLQPHVLGLCLGILALITLVNLRGTRETGLVFMLPTCLFVLCLGGMIVWGIFQILISGGHPTPANPPKHVGKTLQAASAWLILKAFASGCTAMTGVEAVSNGVQAFREDVVRNARRSLTAIIAILMFLLIGLAILTRAYHIAATPPGTPEYESVLSQVLAAVAGKGWFYFVAIASILMVLSLSANTSFADFPRLCRVVAANRYLPYGFTMRGRRLVYSQGVYVLTIFSGLLLIVFGGITDRLIPLFAVGAFLAFTLSQAGMVAHWRKQQGRHTASLIINSAGALVTGITVLIIIVAKFTEGAWITLLMIPGLLALMNMIHRHYRNVSREIADTCPLDLAPMEKPIVLVPISGWNKVTRKALRFAFTMSPEVIALNIDSGEETAKLREQWNTLAVDPASREGLPAPKLVILKSPYRYVLTPILEFALEQQACSKGRKIAVVISELIEKRWYQYPLHAQRGEALTALLVVNGDRGIVVVNVPWYLKS